MPALFSHSPAKNRSFRLLSLPAASRPVKKNSLSVPSVPLWFVLIYGHPTLQSCVNAKIDLKRVYMYLRLHAFEPFSRANGPGLRAVAWFQGCTLRCPGCFNPATHDPEGGLAYDTKKLAADILALGNKIAGVSISGGEPLQQPQALLDLLQNLAASRSGLSTLLFSGYTLPEIDAMPLGAEILPHVDLLIAGRFVASRPCGQRLLGSANQQVHFLSSRHTASDLIPVPARELIIHQDGSLTSSGIRPCPLRCR